MEVFDFLKAKWAFLFWMIFCFSFQALANNEDAASQKEAIHRKENITLHKIKPISPFPEIENIRLEELSHLAEENTVLQPSYLSGRKRTFSQFENFSLETENDFFSTEDIVSDSIEEQRNIAHSLLEDIEKYNKFRDVLDESALLDLPVGIKKTIGNLEYVIMIKEIRITEKGAFLEAYMSFTVPGKNEKIAFRGRDIRFTNDGGLTGDARLELLGDHSIPLSPNSSLTLLEGATYVEWDCNGFKQFGIDSEVSFSRNWLIPVDEKGDQQAGQVSGRVTTSLSSWDDFIAAVSLSRFAVNGVPDVAFRVNNAIFDLSDLRNPIGITPPGASVSLVPRIVVKSSKKKNQQKI